MAISFVRALEILNPAFADARTRDGSRVQVVLSPSESDPAALSVSVMLFDATGTVSDFRGWGFSELPIPAGVDEARLQAFAEALRRGAQTLNWEELRAGEFPIFELLEAPGLTTADEFFAVLSDKVRREDVRAGLYVDALRQKHQLPELPPGANRALYSLHCGLSAQTVFEGDLEVLRRCQGPVEPHLLHLFEGWADDLETHGVTWIAESGGAMSVHLASRAAPWLEERLDEAGRARLDRLRERGLIPAPPLDFEAVFSGTAKELELVELGVIELPSGKLVVADPFFPIEPIEVGPARGCRVRLAFTNLPDAGRRVCVARVDLREGAVRRWENANATFLVDAGLASFMSSEAAAALRRALDALPPGRNYFSDVLQPEMANGFFALHTVEGHAMAIFASGLGDGSHEVWLGFDDESRVLSVAIDFGLMS